LTQLEASKALGLDIPDTLVTNCKSDLLKFYTSHNQIIVKDIRYPVNIKSEKGELTSTGVKIVSQEMLNNLEEQFAISLFQSCIQKEYEIRLFFFDDCYFPMAIFSQSNKKTSVDFRNYDDEKPNRCVPVQIPNDVIEKIKEFNKIYDIATRFAPCIPERSALKVVQTKKTLKSIWRFFLLNYLFVTAEGF